MMPYSGNIDLKTLLLTLKIIAVWDEEGTPSGAIYEQQHKHGMNSEEHEVVMTNLVSEGFATREYIFGNPVYRLTELGREMIVTMRDSTLWSAIKHGSAD